MCASVFQDLGLKKPSVDFSYIQKYGFRDKYKIPTCFQQSNFKQGQSFEARITQIYDPSKFWMVTKHRELEIFQKYLFKFYYMNRTLYKMPEERVELYLYCVAFIDNAYYRGVIVGFPITHQNVLKEVQLYFLDYGMLGTISIDNLYYISETCLKVPQFAIRASLAGICPTERTWSADDVTRFHNLVADKVVKGVVLNIDPQRESVEAVICVDDGDDTISIQETLIKEKCGVYFHEKPDEFTVEEKLLFPYLFPSFEALESGKVPVAVSDYEYHEQIAPPTSIYTRYEQNVSDHGKS